jgi:hypothetical protein
MNTHIKAVSKRTVLTVIVIAAITLFLTGCFPGMAGGGQQQVFITNPLFHPEKDLLAFVSNHDGDAEIFLVKPDGTGLKKLTDNSATDINPVWSPDGKTIVFVSDRDGQFELFKMNEDGTNVSKIPLQIEQLSSGK